MIIQQYGITLRRLTLEDIELVRRWRNDLDIQQTMNFREQISKEMQVAWFHRINNPLNYYFIIEYKNDKIGLINAKNVSVENHSVEGGIFVWDQRYRNDLQPVYASLCLMNGAFKNMRFFQKFIVNVRRDNVKAVTYNSLLGYTINEEKSDENNFQMELTREDYLENSDRINNIAQKMTDGTERPVIRGVFDADLYLEEFREILRDEFLDKSDI